MKQSRRYLNRYTQKQSFNQTMQFQLNILKSSSKKLQKILSQFSKENPYIQKVRNSATDFIEGAITQNDESIYEKIESQIQAPFFPTPPSQKVALEILYDLNKDGFFDGDIEMIAHTCQVSVDFVEQIRKRFVQCIEPYGVGSINIEESFLSQLDNLDLDLDQSTYEKTKFLIENFDKLQEYYEDKYYQEAFNSLKKFHNPPAVEYLDDMIAILPECKISVKDTIEINFTNKMYTDYSLALCSVEDQKLQKEAKEILKAIDLRKSLLEKIVSIIVQVQPEFLKGGELRPLLIKEVAKNLNLAPSTISRAIAHKYLEYDFGIIELKNFFTKDLQRGGVSPEQIYSYLKDLIESEPKNKPLSDDKIVQKVKQKFDLTLARRTIAKYRQHLCIPSSRDRKVL